MYLSNQKSVNGLEWGVPLNFERLGARVSMFEDNMTALVSRLNSGNSEFPSKLVAGFQPTFECGGRKKIHDGDDCSNIAKGLSERQNVQATRDTYENEMNPYENEMNLTRRTESYRMEDGVKTGGENGTTGTKWCTTTPTGTMESAYQKRGYCLRDPAT